MLVVVMTAADQSFHKFLWCIPSYLKENVSCFIFHAEQLMRKKCWFTAKTYKRVSFPRCIFFSLQNYAFIQGFELNVDLLFQLLLCKSV